MEKEYAKFCKYYANDFNRLKGKVFKIRLNGKFIFNIFSQKPNFDTDYEAMKIALQDIKENVKGLKLSIAMPYGIGCGIAKGEWRRVYKIIEEVFSDYEVTLYKLN